MATTTCTETCPCKSTCYECVKLFITDPSFKDVSDTTENLDAAYYECLHEYASLVEKRFPFLEDPCYRCLCLVQSWDEYERRECCHCDNDFYFMDYNHFMRLINLRYVNHVAVYQSAQETKTTEVEASDQVDVDHNVQPNQIRQEGVMRKSLISIPPTIENVFERQYLFTQGHVWLTSNAVGDILQNLPLPRALLYEAYPFAGFVEYHGILRATIEIEIKMNTNPFVCGQLLLCAIPANFGNNPVGSFTMSQCSEIYPHSYLTAGFETNAKILIPFVSPHYALINTTTSPDTAENHHFVLYVWNVLRVATGQPLGYNYSVWFRFLDVEQGVKVPSSATKTIYQAAKQASLLDKFVGIGKNIGGAIKDMNIPVLSQVAKVVGGVTGWFDSPLVQESTQYDNAVCNVPKHAISLRVMDNDYSDSSTYESIDLNKYIQVYGRLHIIEWNTSQNAGSLLFSIPTTINQTGGTPATLPYQIPLLETSRFYRFWRGTLKVKFHVVATHFHQGQLLVSWVPFGVANTITQARAAYYMSIDIGQQNVFEMEVPFLYPVDYMTTDQAVHGMISVWVQNALIAPQNVSSTISVNVYLAGCDDIEFACMRDERLAIYQSAADEGESKVWKPLARTQVTSKRMNGHTNIDAFVKRPSRMFTNVLVTTVNTQFRNIAKLPYIPLDEMQHWPLRPLMVSGGVRWTITATTPVNSSMVWYTYLTYDDLSGNVILPTGTAAPFVDTTTTMRSGGHFNAIHSTNERVSRFEVPMYLPTEYTSLFRLNDPLSPRPYLNVCVRTNLITEGYVAYYWEAADDFRMHWPVTPSIRHLPTQAVHMSTQMVEDNVDGDDYDEVDCNHVAVYQNVTYQTQNWQPDEECYHVVVMQGFLAEIFKNLFDWATSVKDRVLASCHNLVDKISIAKNFIVGISEAKTWAENFSRLITFLSEQIFPAILALYSAWNDTGIIRAIALTQLTSIAFSLSCPDKLKEGVVVKQGPETEQISDVVDSMSKNICVAVLQMFGFKLSADYDTYIRRMTVGTQRDSWEYCVKVFGHSVLYFIHGKSLNVEWERKQKEPLAKVLTSFTQDEVDGYFTSSRLLERRLGTGKTNLEILKSYFETTQTYFEKNLEFVIPNSFGFTIEKIRKAYIKAMSLDRSEPNQAEPIGILLSGRPGVGKSFFVNTMLASLVLPELPDIPFHPNPIYAIPFGDQQYWDGYRQQPILTMDEAFQERDGKDALNIINIISTAKVPVNMADLTDKGIEFKSSFLVANTNESSWNNINNVLNKDALTRRFENFSVQMSVGPGYKTAAGFFDAEKASKAMTALADKYTNAIELRQQLAILGNDFWTLTKREFGVVQTFSESNISVTFSDFIASIVQEYKRRKTIFETCDTFNKNLRERMKLQGPSDDESETDYSETSESDVFEQPRIEPFFTSSSVGQSAEIESVVDACHISVKTTNADYDRHVDGILVELANLANRFEDEVFIDTEVDDVIETYQQELTLILGMSTFVREQVSKHTFKKLETHHLSKLNLVHLERIRTWKKSSQRGIWIGVCAALAGIGLASTAIYFAVTKFSSIFKGVLPVLQSYTGDAALKKLKSVQPITNVLKAVHQNSGYPDFHSLIHNNMVQMEIYKTECGESTKLTAIFLDDRTLLCNQHLVTKYILWNTEGVAVATINYKIKGNDESYPLRLEPSNVLNVPVSGEVSDLCLIKCRTPARGIRDIWKYVARKDEFKERTQIPCYIKGGDRTYHNSNDITATLSHFTKFSGARGFYLQAYPDEQTLSGDCGRPYILSKVSAHHPLVGLHACFLTTDGVTPSSPMISGAVPLIYETLMEINAKFDVKQHLEPEIVEMQSAEAYSPYWDGVPLRDNLVCNGVKMVHHMPSVTNLKPLTHNGERLKHSEWKCDYVPAALKPLNGKHPLISNASKYTPVSAFAVDSATHNCVLDHFTNKFEESRDITILSDFEAINGREEMNSLQYNTGCGYWNMFGFKNGKKDFFEELPQEIDSITGEALEKKRVFSQKAREHIVPIWNLSFCDRYKQCEDLARRGEIFTTFWISTNKDELRPIEKVRACKTRVFEQPGLEYTLLVRKYFGTFLTYVKTRPGFTLYHGIGADKEVVWGEYSRQLRKNSPYGHAFDYKNWDGSVTPDAFQFFEDVCQRFYVGAPKEEHLVRSVLIRVLRDSHHVMGNYYFRSGQGNKSGNPFTDVFNSICNFYVMAVAYCKTRRMAGLSADMVDFDKDVKMLTYGDDIVMTVKPIALSYFSGPNIQAIMELYGYKITDALKSGVIPEHMLYSDLTFLKSSFVDRGDVCLSPIPKEDIYKELCYAPKGSIGDVLDLQQRVMNTCRFMSHHGPDALQLFKTQLREKSIPREWLSQTFTTFVDDIKQKQATSSIY